MSVHFDLPFRFDTTGSAVVVDQGSDADIQACVTAILLWRRGVRHDRPEIGIDDPVFRQGGANLEAIRDMLAEQEPRADALIERDPPLLASLVDQVTVDRRRTV